VVEFAWMKSGIGTVEPAGNTAMAVADPPVLPAGHADEFVYNPWKMKDVRRLYINLTDGTKIGYLDLATLDAVPESGSTAEQLQRALAGLSPVAAERRFNRSTQLGEAAPAPRPALTKVMSWADLSANRPGQLIENEDDASYRAGVAGEQRTAGVLAGLEHIGYRVLHSIPLSPRKDIDHLVIGPTGIWTVNTKATTYDVTAKAGGAVYSDGYRQKWIESITRDAAVAAEHLSAAARMDLQCQPLVAVWSTMSVSSSHDALVAGETLLGAITGPVDRFPAEWADVIYNVARRSDTWTAHH
jgi:hypothetical protein